MYRFHSDMATSCDTYAICERETHPDELEKWINLEREILDLLSEIQTDTDYVESELKDIVYGTRTKFNSGPKELHIVLNTIIVHGIANYSSFSNYIRIISSWFIVDECFGEEISRILCLLEVQYVGGIGECAVAVTYQNARNFGSVVGDLVVESRYCWQESCNTLELCLIGFVSKWSSSNQIHWEEQGIALSSLLANCIQDLRDRFPRVLEECFRNVGRLVDNNVIPNSVKVHHMSVIHRHNPGLLLPLSGHLGSPE